MFESFINELPRSGVLRVRVSDNVMGSDDWSIDSLVIRMDMVRAQQNVCKGIHTIPNMVGWTIDELIMWTHQEPAGPVEYYYEVDMPMPTDRCPKICEYDEKDMCGQCATFNTREM